MKELHFFVSGILGTLIQIFLMSLIEPGHLGTLMHSYALRHIILNKHLHDIILNKHLHDSFK